MTIKGTNFNLYDEIIITGTIRSESPHVGVVRLPGVIATISADEIKVWPHDDRHPGLPRDRNGELWFRISEIEEIEMRQE